jgi:hypothetical protein
MSSLSGYGLAGGSKYPNRHREQPAKRVRPSGIKHKPQHAIIWEQICSQVKKDEGLLPAVDDNIKGED